MDRQVRIIGAPMDFGANRRGVDMGPSAIRYAGLSETLEATGVRCVDGGDLNIPRPEERDPDTNPPRVGKAKFLREVAAVCSQLETDVAETISGGSVPLVLGGDHSVSMGSMAGASQSADIGVIWFDAHADINTPETSPSGNVHGMPLAGALGRGLFGEMAWAQSPSLREEAVAYVGLRCLDEHERHAVRDSEMTAFTMSDIDRRGITAVVDDALEVATDGTEGVHVSLDVDWLDPNTAPGVGTPVRGGVTYREAHAAMERVSRVDRRDAILRSIDVVEVNPILDQHNETATLATELTASLFGNRIL